MDAARADHRARLFGHLPGHLALIDPERSLRDNAAEHLLASSGRLVDDAQHVLDAFMPDASVHYSVLEAIAGGDTTWGRITSRVGRSGGALSRPLSWLEGMDLLERTVPVTEKRPEHSRRAVYRITDPYIALWHRLIAPLVPGGSIGLVDPDQLWQEMVAPQLGGHMGFVFEACCRAFVRRQSRAATSALPFRPLRVGTWWDGKGVDEVDVVALGAGGDVLVGEAKWGPVTGRHLATLRRRSQRVVADLDGESRVHLALFTGSGEADDSVMAEVKAGRVHLFTVTDLVSD